MMRIRAGLASICIFLVALPSDSLGRQGKEKAEAEAQLASAREHSSIRAEGSPPFRFHASIDFPGTGDPKLRQGSYLEVWSSSDRWRIEIKGLGYEEISGRTGSKFYRKANLRYRPWPLYRVAQLFRIQKSSGREMPAGVQDVKVKKSGENTVVCVRENVKAAMPRLTVCVDQTKGLLTSAEDYSGEMEYAAYAALGTKEYPRSLRWSYEGRLVADVHVDSLGPLTDAPTGAFEPPEGADESPACEKPEPPRRLSGSEPGYTPHARAEKIQGHNAAYVVIGKDGKVIYAEIVSPLEPGLDVATLNAIHQWHFQPSTCVGVPADTPTFVETSFRLF